MNAKSGLCIIILSVLVFSAPGVVWSADTNVEGANAILAQGVEESTQEATDSADGGDKNCTWACLRWGKMCNVDPRGVYKCRKTCEKFGEQCE